jgi:hypothetical protein
MPRSNGTIPGVSGFLESQLEPVSRKTVEKNVSGKVEYLRIAMDRLLEEGCAQETTGERSARMMTSQAPFREDDLVPTSSLSGDATSSHLVPDVVPEDTA